MRCLWSAGEAGARVRVEHAGVRVEGARERVEGTGVRVEEARVQGKDAGGRVEGAGLRAEGAGVPQVSRWTFCVLMKLYAQAAFLGSLRRYEGEPS